MKSLTSPNRRDSIKQITTLAGLLVGAGYPQFSTAAYNKTSFETKSINEAIKMQGGGVISESKEVLINAPDYAENGAAVAMGVSTFLPDVRKILILIEKNPATLAASFQVSDAVESNFSTRVKMSQTSDVYFVAISSDGRAMYAKKEVKVTIGGCGA